jgi:hypothetical protein
MIKYRQSTTGIALLNQQNTTQINMEVANEEKGYMVSAQPICDKRYVTRLMRLIE